MRRAALSFALLGAFACKPDVPGVPDRPGPPQPELEQARAPQAELDGLERRLLEQDFVLEFVIKSEGAVASDLKGSLQVTGEFIEMQATGTFADTDQDLSWDSDYDTLTIKNAGGEHKVPCPPKLREAIVIGLTRMGLLHNLAMLTGGAPPDHGEGGVTEWVQLGELSPQAEVEVVGTSAEARAHAPITFTINVSGEKAGRTTLWTDLELGRPVQRHQIVQFPEGEMRVLETYTVVQ